jgi:hypothetical protein
MALPGRPWRKQRVLSRPVAVVPAKLLPLLLLFFAAALPSQATAAGAAAEKTSAFLPSSSTPQLRRRLLCSPVRGSGSTSGEAPAAVSVRLPPSIQLLGAEDDRVRTTPALAAATAAARASTTGVGNEEDEAASGLMVERVGSRDMEIRLPPSFTPLERIAVSAEGDLQRIVASYYNAAVAVAIRRCQEVEPGLFDREVDLSVLGGQVRTRTG